MLGQMEERPGDGFGGAAEVEDTDEFLPLLQRRSRATAWRTRSTLPAG